MGPNPSESESQVQLSRRQWLAVTGSLSAAAMAGCSTDNEGSGNGNGNGNGGNGNGNGNGGNGNGNGNGGNGNGNGNGGSTVIDQTFQQSFTSYPPTDMQFNAAVPNNSPHIGGTGYRDWAFAPLGRNNSATGKFQKGLLTDLSFNLDADTPNVVLKFPEGWLWWPSGNDVTVEDFASQLRMGKYGVFGQTNMTDSVSSISIEDDQTLRLNLKSSNINKTIWTGTVGAFLTTEHERYKKWVKDLADADGYSGLSKLDENYGAEINNEDAVKEVVNTIQQSSIDTAFGNGPFKVKEVNQQQFVWERYEDHAVADKVNWSGVQHKFMSGDAAQQAFMNGRLDYQGKLAEQFKNNLPDFAERVTFPAGVGPWLMFNFGKEPTSNIHFRRAVMYLISNSEIAKAMGSRWEPIELPCGLHKGQASEWLSNPDSFLQYNENKEKAAEELRAGGWEKSGGKWVDGNGNPLKLTVKSKAGNTPWVTTAQVTNARLQEFGIKSEMLTEEGTTYHGNTLPNGDYQVAVRFGGGWSMYPYFSMANGLSSDRARKSYNMPKTAKIPPIGKPDAERSEEIDFREVTSSIAQTADEEKVRQKVEQLAWAWNYLMPFGCTTEQLGDRYLNTDGWEFPTDPAKIPGGTPRPGFMAMEDALSATE